ncbi:MAG: SGNH/GDSL hydrolase family protein [Hespellia sp.]|nr:SGNH/GDSL hydrolase family protein [Hespellia sp.]
MKNILCFGDSNTYGYIPDESGRFDSDTRWTGRLQKMLGEEYHIIEEGLCGRTSVFQDDLREGRRGIDVVGVAVESHNPLDMLIVMLGTNDCKTRYGASAEVIAKGVEELIEKAKSFAAKELKILVVSPILLKEGVGADGFDPEFDAHSELVSRKLSKAYRAVAESHGYDFLDAAKVSEASERDREHMDAVGHEALAEAILKKIQQMLPNSEIVTA